jgi:hypothetical protein
VIVGDSPQTGQSRSRRSDLRKGCRQRIEEEQAPGERVAYAQTLQRFVA